MIKNRKTKIKYFVLLAIMVVVAALLAFALNAYIHSGDKVVVRMEVTFAILILLLVLPLLLLLLWVALLFKGGKSQTVISAKNVVSNAKSAVVVPQQVVSVKASAQQEVDEEGEDRSRFYMLCEIDANQAKYQRALSI